MRRKATGLQGITFGAIDAIINIVGITTGLGTIGNRTATIIGLLAAGIANSFGNAAGFHVSEESEGIHSPREVWISTLLSFLGTFIFTFILLTPLFLMELRNAIISCWIIGILSIISLGVWVGKTLKLKKSEIVKLTAEYLVICMSVILLTYFIGKYFSSFIL